MTDTEKEGMRNLDRLVRAVDKAYHHPGPLVWRGFLIGLASGVGGTIGVAIVVGLLTLLVGQLGGIPIIGEALRDLLRTISGGAESSMLIELIRSVG